MITFRNVLIILTITITSLSAGYYFGYNHGFDGAIKVNNTGSGITGIVLIGPTCPVIRDAPEEQCADRPFKTNLALIKPDQSTVIKQFSSDTNGGFTINAAPGEYTIRSAAAANILPYCSSDTVKVNPNSYTETVVYCDSGIR
jgi:hypothetical protein